MRGCGWMVSLLLFFLLAQQLGSNPASARRQQLALAVDSATGAFNVSVGMQLWLRGKPPVMAGCVKSTQTPLTLTKHVATDDLLHPTLGKYSEIRFYWSAVVDVETAIQTFEDGETVLFAQHWPNGLSRCGANRTRSGELLSFPLFGAGGREQDLGALTWTGAFSQHSLSSLRSLPTRAISRANGGPVVMIDEHQSFRSLVVSPFDNFLAASQSTIAESPPPAPPPGPKWTCPTSAGCAQVKEQTDVTGNPKVDLGHKDNLTRAQCCELCSMRGRDCEAWARVPGERSTCWMVGSVSSFAHSSDREVGCPSHSHLHSRGGDSSAASTSWQWSVGISSQVVELPKGFNHTTVLRLGSGVTGTLQSWGQTMRTVYKTKRNPDMALSHLSYLFLSKSFSIFHMHNQKSHSSEQVLDRQVRTEFLRIPDAICVWC